MNLAVFFEIVVIAFVITLITGFLFEIFLRWKLYKAVAAAVSKSEWKALDFDESYSLFGRLKFLSLEIQTLDCRDRIWIPFSPSHPSIEAIRKLEKYDPLEFEYVKTNPLLYLWRMRGPCAYLLVKKKPVKNTW